MFISFIISRIVDCVINVASNKTTKSVRYFDPVQTVKCLNIQKTSNCISI